MLNNEKTKGGVCMNNFSDVFGGLKVGEPARSGGLWFVPVFNDGAGPDADMLEEGISSGATKVSEVGTGGIVGEIVVEHKGARRLLIIDGEVVMGAKQDRIFNASFIVDPGMTVHVPVSCVEHGRWHARRSYDFSASGQTLSSKAREKKLHSVAFMLSSHGLYDSDQHEVWNSVNEISSKHSVHSGTGSYSEVFRTRHHDVEEKLKELKVQDGQVGVIVVHGGKFVSFDLFGSPSLFCRGWKKVLRGVFTEIFNEVPAETSPAEIARKALEQLASVQALKTKAPGSGVTISGKKEKIAVQAICDGNELYHAYAAQS